MARVTVEDCVTRVPNRFELVMVAAQRGRNIGAGAPLTLDRDNDKNAVVALREIAEAKVDLKELENGLIRGLQTVVEADEPEGEEMDLLPISEEVAEELGEARGEARADQVMSEDELHFEDDAVAAQDISDDLDLELGSVAGLQELRPARPDHQGYLPPSAGKPGSRSASGTGDAPGGNRSERFVLHRAQAVSQRGFLLRHHLQRIRYSRLDVHGDVRYRPHRRLDQPLD